jgi:hypothetical protein
MVGAHDRHDPNEGRTDGLIGGYYCGCTGDCAARFAVALDQLRGRLTPFKEDSNG